MQTINNEKLLKYAPGIFTDLSEIGERESEEKKIEIKIEHSTTEPFVLDIQADKKNVKFNYEIRIEDEVEVTIIEQLEVKEYLELSVHLKVAPNAKVTYISFQNIPQNVYCIAKRGGDVSANARLTWIDVNLGGKIVKSDLETNLLGDRAKGETYGLFFGNVDQVFDFYHVMHHQHEKTESTIDTKGVLTNTAKAVYRGLIKIDQAAKQSKGFEREDTLLLSTDAQISTIPDLEIGTNDVQCSHAVTTTNVDKEKLFYLTSRGIEKDEAVKMCVTGHFAPILQRIKNEELRSKIERAITEKLVWTSKK